MRFILTLLVGIALGIAAVWYFNHNKNNSQFATAGQEIKSTAQNAGDALSDKLRSWNLDREHITNELANTGRVIRDKANAAGQALKDATADARVTAAIKAKIRQRLRPLRLGRSRQHDRWRRDPLWHGLLTGPDRQSHGGWRWTPTAPGRSSPRSR